MSVVGDTFGVVRGVDSVLQRCLVIPTCTLLQYAEIRTFQDQYAASKPVNVALAF